MSEPGGLKAEAMDLLIGFGDAVKALPEGKIGGYVVRFSDEHTPDLSGEFFTAKTDFGQPFPARLGFYYHHGMDETIGKRRLAYADVKMDADGIWFQTQLDLADAYQAKIWQLAEAGKLGASSGAVKHLVERQRVGDADWLKSWPVGEVSATPTPCEPRTSAAALKAWLDEAPSFQDLSAGLPAAVKTFSLAENTEQWLDRGADLLGQFRRLGAAEAKAGKPQFSAARVERMQRMYETLSELLRECGGMPQETPIGEAEPATGMGANADAAALAGPAQESQFLTTLARLNGVFGAAPTAAEAAGG